MILLGIFFISPFFSFSNTFIEEKKLKKTKEILEKIYNEVIELKREEEKEFIKREFHINLDDREINQEEHVVVLIFPTEEIERMLLQVTYFKPNKKESYIETVDQIKNICCLKKKGKIEIENSDYPEEEIKPLLKDILRGIRDKKKLLNLIKKDKKI